MPKMTTQPRAGGVVIPFPTPPDDFSDVDPRDISRRFREARQAGVAEVRITKREADAVRYWRAQLAAEPRPRAIVEG